MSKKFLIFAVFTLFFFTKAGFSQELDAKVNEVVKPLIDGKKNLGMVIGVYEAGSDVPKMYFFGKIAKEDSTKPNEFTVYEIGSVTNVFTTTMLVMLERDGKMQVNDPVQNYMPAGVTIHNFVSTEPIKLLHLATQTSGLPRYPTNLMSDPKTDKKNPFKNYKEDDFLYFINNYIPEYEPGQNFIFSTAGMGLLGDLMARTSGKSYEELLHYYLLDSLGMSMTSTKLEPVMKINLAKGYTEKGEPSGPWEYNSLEGSGAIKSNLSDMLRFLAFQMGKSDKLDFNQGLTLMQRRKFDADIPNTAIGMGWYISETMGDRTAIWSNGQTGGYRSHIAFIPETKTGVVILTNQASDVDLVAVEILKFLNK